MRMIQMQKFHEFLSLREFQDTQTPLSQQMQQPQEPQIGARMQQQNNFSPEEDNDRELENISNSLNRILEKLFKVMDRSQLSKQKALNMLSVIDSKIANRYRLNNTQVRQAANTAIRTNTEPKGPQTQPMQPMASG